MKLKLDSMEDAEKEKRQFLRQLGELKSDIGRQPDGGTPWRTASKNGPIVYEIHDQDDPIVKVLKLAVNASNISLQDLYDRGETYNLYYYLVVRHSVAHSTVERWLKILGRRMAVHLEIS
jgi:hypothetical protein